MCVVSYTRIRTRTHTHACTHEHATAILYRLFLFALQLIRTQSRGVPARLDAAAVLATHEAKNTAAAAAAASSTSRYNISTSTGDNEDFTGLGSILLAVGVLAAAAVAGAWIMMKISKK